MSVGQEAFESSFGLSRHSFGLKLIPLQEIASGVCDRLHRCEPVAPEQRLGTLLPSR